jgi:hypothetical protein
VDECADGVTAGQKREALLCDKAVIFEFTERKTKRKRVRRPDTLKRSAPA